MDSDLEEGEIKEDFAPSVRSTRSSKIGAEHRPRTKVRKSRHGTSSRSRSKKSSPAPNTSSTRHGKSTASNHHRRHHHKGIEENSSRNESQLIRSLHGKQKTSQKRRVESSIKGDSSQPNIVVSVANDTKKSKMSNAQKDNKSKTPRKGISFSITNRRASSSKSLPAPVQENSSKRKNSVSSKGNNIPPPAFIFLDTSQVEDVSENSDNDDNVSIISLEVPEKPPPEVVTIDSSAASETDDEEDVEELHLRRLALQDLMSKLHKNVNAEKEQEQTRTNRNRHYHHEQNITVNNGTSMVSEEGEEESDNISVHFTNGTIISNNDDNDDEDEPYSPCDEDITRKIKSTETLTKEEEQIMFAKAREQWNLMQAAENAQPSSLSSHSDVTSSPTSPVPEHVLKEQNSFSFQENGRIGGLKINDKENIQQNKNHNNFCSKSSLSLSSSAGPPFITLPPPPPPVDPFEFQRPPVLSSLSEPIINSINNMDNNINRMTSTATSTTTNTTTSTDNIKDLYSSLFVPHFITKDIDMRFPNYSSNLVNFPSTPNILNYTPQEQQLIIQQYQQQLLNSLPQQQLFVSNNTQYSVNPSNLSSSTASGLNQLITSSSSTLQNTTGTILTPSAPMINSSAFFNGGELMDNNNFSRYYQMTKEMPFFKHSEGMLSFSNLAAASAVDVMNPSTISTQTTTPSSSSIYSTSTITSTTTTATLGSTPQLVSQIPSTSATFAINMNTPNFLNVMPWPAYTFNLNPFSTDAITSSLSATTTTTTTGASFNSTPAPPPPPIPIEPTPPPPPPPPPTEDKDIPAAPATASKLVLPHPPPPPILRFKARSDNSDSSNRVSNNKRNKASSSKSVPGTTTDLTSVEEAKINMSDLSSDDGHCRYDEPPSSPSPVPRDVFNSTDGSDNNSCVPIIIDLDDEEGDGEGETLLSKSVQLSQPNLSKEVQITSSTVTATATETITIPPSLPKTDTSPSNKIAEAVIVTANSNNVTKTSSSVPIISSTTVSVPSTESVSLNDLNTQENVDEMNSFVEDEEILRAQLLLEISRKKKDPIVSSVSSLTNSQSYTAAVAATIRPTAAKTTTTTTTINLRSKTIPNSNNIIIPIKKKQFTPQLPPLQSIYSKDNRPQQSYTKINTNIISTTSNRVQSQLKPVINKKSKNRQIVRVINNSSNINSTSSSTITLNGNTFSTSNIVTTNPSINSMMTTATTTARSPNMHNIQRTIINTNVLKKNNYNPNADPLMRHLKITVPNQNITPLIIRVGQDESSSEDETCGKNIEIEDKTKKRGKLEEKRKKIPVQSNSRNEKNVQQTVNIPSAVVKPTLSLPSSTSIPSSSATTEAIAAPPSKALILPDSFEMSLNNLLKTSREHSKNLSITTTTTTTNPTSIPPVEIVSTNLVSTVSSSPARSSPPPPSLSPPTNTPFSPPTHVPVNDITTTVSNRICTSVVSESQDNFVLQITSANKDREITESTVSLSSASPSIIPFVDAAKQREELYLRERLLKATLIKKMKDQNDRLGLRKLERNIVQSRKSINRELNTLLSEMVKISDIKVLLKEQQEKVDLLRRQLQAAESKLNMTVDCFEAKEAKRKSLTTHVFSMRKECVQLVKQCREQGIKIEGENYKVPATEALEMHSKLSEVRNQNLVFRRNAGKLSPKKSLVLTPTSLKRSNSHTSATLAAANRVKKFVMTRSRMGKRNSINASNGTSSTSGISTYKFKLPSTPQQIRMSRRFQNKKLLESSTSNKKHLWLTKYGRVAEDDNSYDQNWTQDNNNDDQDVFLLPRMFFKDVLTRNEEDKDAESGTWTPYKSPLISIKSTPLDDHSGIRKSIDPFITLCYFELRTMCNSFECPFQHLYKTPNQKSK